MASVVQMKHLFDCHIQKLPNLSHPKTKELSFPLLHASSKMHLNQSDNIFPATSDNNKPHLINIKGKFTYSRLTATPPSPKMMY